MAAFRRGIWIMDELIVDYRGHENLESTAKTFVAHVEWDAETELYVGIIPGIIGAHTQGETLDELRENLKEVLELCLDE